MLRMMVVDDNPNDRRGITELINWKAMDIEIVGTAVNGELGYHKALELRPDIILTDVAMPRMNGIEMTKKIREEMPETRFVYMSCFDDVAYLQGAIDQEVTAYLLKPIDTEQMVHAIRKICNRQKYDQSKKKSDDDLLRLLTDNMPHLREQLLLEIIFSSGKLPSDLSSRLSALQMDLSCDQYVIGIMRITPEMNPDFHGSSAEQRRAIAGNVRRCVQETILIENKGYMACPHPETLIWIRKFASTDLGDITCELSDSVNSCLELAYDRYGVTFHAKVCEATGSLQDISEVYRRADLGEGLLFELQLRGNDAGRHGQITADIKRIIDSRYREIENVNQIMKGLYISASHANHIFKMVTGQTIFDYVVQRKMEVAAQMLQNPYIRVSEIPEKVGYKSDAHFRSVFKSFAGMTPKQYQERNSVKAGVLQPG